MLELVHLTQTETTPGWAVLWCQTFGDPAGLWRGWGVRPRQVFPMTSPEGLSPREAVRPSLPPSLTSEGANRPGQWGERGTEMQSWGFLVLGLTLLPDAWLSGSLAQTATP